jgi:two-component system, cell cycle sensor histidine kinase and response regulator CckA
VTSSEGHGATFKISLPLSEKPEATPAPPVSAARERTGSETILLVEDEPMVRSFLRTVLARHGYKVLEAAGGAEALRVSEQYVDTIHLLITDIVMPGMSGREVAERLAPARPEMKILFISGYTDDDLLRHGVLKAPDTFLAKPFTAATLNEKVRALLAGTCQPSQANMPASAAALVPA